MLRDASIGQIVTEMRYNYATNSCSQSPTTDYVAYHYDHIGNVVALSDCDGYGTMREGFDMEAFGNLHQGSQNGVRLTTKEYDPDAGLYYFGARWYDPELGKWMEKEPNGIDGPNLYTFVTNNPVNAIDINGRSTMYFYDDPQPNLNAAIACYSMAQREAARADKRHNGFDNRFGQNVSAHDAMRHCVGSCCLQQKFGSDAKAFDWRENPKSRGGKRDIINNKIGREIGKCPDANCGEECFKKLLNNELAGGISADQ